MSQMLVPNIWPIGNMMNIILLQESQIKSFDDKQKATKTSDVGQGIYGEILARQIKNFMYCIVAYSAYTLTFPSYDSIINESSSSSWWFKWLFIIILRDQCIIFIVYSFWHYLLFHSSYKNKMKKVKYNKEYPDQKRWIHDRMWSLNGGLITSLIELSIIYFYKLYPNLLQKRFWNKTFYISILWILFVDFWRMTHFYFIHRAIHPWFKKDSKYKFFIPDIGSYLFKYVHYLHHESCNPGPWSGLSMHPIEHIIYYSCIYIPLIFGIKQHPLHFLTNKMSTNLAPISGHDGFDAPGGGGYYHYLHHAHFECNYGTAWIDKLFGTFEDGTKYKKKN